MDAPSDSGSDDDDSEGGEDDGFVMEKEGERGEGTAAEGGERSSSGDELLPVWGEDEEDFCTEQVGGRPWIRTPPPLLCPHLHRPAPLRQRAVTPWLLFCRPASLSLLFNPPCLIPGRFPPATAAPGTRRPSRLLLFCPSRCCSRPFSPLLGAPRHPSPPLLLVCLSSSCPPTLLLLQPPVPLRQHLGFMGPDGAVVAAGADGA